MTVISALGLSAQQTGKVYQIINDQYKTAVTSTSPTGGLVCNEADESKFAQLWLVESGTGRTSTAFRNLATGLYLKSAAGTHQDWGLEREITDASSFRITDIAVGNNTVYTIRAKSLSEDNYGFMHCDQQSAVVCWNTSAATSQWIFKEVEVSAEDIANAAAPVEAVNSIMNQADTYAEVLDRIFADKACTRLKGTPSQADLDALSPVLRAMVAKAQSGDWSEVNNNNASIKWDSAHAARFRNRPYNVFSRGWEITGLTGNQPYTNMNNPTGIMANAYEVLYVMVDQAPKDGATLYLGLVPHNLMANEWQTEYPLHEGLNMIPVWSDNNMAYIYYTAQTWEEGGDRHSRPAHKLAEFPPINIHIEGGIVNSYWDKEIDTEDDWQYYRDRAQHTMYDILGTYSHLRFFLDRKGHDVGDAPNAPGLRQVLAPDAKEKIFRAADTWDQVFIAETMAMGLLSDEEIDKYDKGEFYNHNTGDKIARGDIREYFNNRHMGIEAQNVGSPNGGSWRTCYPAGNPTGYMDVIDGDIWCVHHEFGHMNQGPIKLVGTTEMSNNGLANIATYVTSNRTSRASYIKYASENFNNGGIFIENDLWSCARMFYQLWLYYHGAGYNKNFFPRLYELLRRDPLTQHPTWDPAGPTKQLEDGLHFAKMACIAAEEDLTEFFEGWGFLTPCDNFLVGDYTNHYLSLTKAEADQWRKEIAELGYPKNVTPLFIDERPGTSRVSYPEQRFAIEYAGEFGGVEHFKAHTRVTRPFTYAISGNAVTMEGGEGGIGFIVRDSAGKMIAFSNSATFNVSPAAAKKLLSGEAHIYALGEGRDTAPVECASTMASASAEKRAELLSDLVKSTAPYADNIDDDGRIVRKYKAQNVGALRDLHNEALEVLANAEASKYEDMFNRLSAEYYSVQADKNKTIRFIPGSTYHLSLRGDNAGNQYANSLGSTSRSLRLQETDLDNDYQQWTFEPLDGNHYAIRNVHSGNYLQGIEERGTNGDKYTLGKNPAPFSIEQVNDFDYVIYCQDSWKYSINWNGGIGSWIGESGDWGNSQFRFTLVEADPMGAARVNLDETIDNAANLLEEAGKVDVEPRALPVPLGEEDSYYFSNAKCKSTEWGDQFVSFSVVNDTTVSTFFHSDYSGQDTDDGLDHYIGIDLGGGAAADAVTPTVTAFHIYYTTRGVGAGNSPVCAPSDFTVQGSVDGKEWIDLDHISSGLPSALNKEYISDAITSPVPVRYIRMVVHATSDGRTAGGHQYFIVSEFGIAAANFTATPSAEYPAVTPELLKDFYYQLAASRKVREMSNDPAELNASAAALLDARNRIAAAMGVPTGIDSVIGDDTDAAGAAAAKGIFDLSARRLRSASAPGLYIIDGRKVLVK